MNNERNRVCPVELANSLDSKVRSWVQNPKKILRPYIKEGMTVLDIGCGPGFFSVAIADMVGKNGKVIAADMQEGMLQKLYIKIAGTQLEERIKLHKSQQHRIGLSEKVDFILAFYMIHEVPSTELFLTELKDILNEGGKFLIVEPKLFHVSKKDFAATLGKAKRTGFKVVDQPKFTMSHAALLVN
jgi:ubiquinone/menaquinone biosynthesis C-methylase UbiE